MASKSTLQVGGQQLEVEACFVTPPIAAEWMKRNLRNRNQSDKDMLNIAQAMKRGEWVVTGETIVFDSDGVLVDGQHRLRAVMHSGVSVWAIIVRGVAPVLAQDATGVVRRRTLNTQLQVRKEKNANSLAAAINYLWQLREHGSLAGRSNPSVTQGLEYLNAHPEIRDHQRARHNLRYSPMKFSEGLAAALSYEFSQVDAQDNDTFWELFASGAELAEDSPILHLRNRLISHAQSSSKVSHSRLTIEHRAALTIKAWNLWRQGRTVRQLTWKPGGAKPEPFPTWTQEAA
jgi:hypothetical protein